MGPAPPPCKENYATETCTTNENNTSVLEEAGPGLPGRMTCCGESRKEATMPMTFLSTRKTLNIGTWNVRTMYEAGKTAQVTAEMRRFNLAVLGLCETRWTQSGQLRLTTGELILYSGHEEEDAPHSEGVGLLLRKEAQKALIGWEARGSRIITACFKTKNKKIKMNIVKCYAPTNDKTDETKEEFYNQLHDIMSNLGDKNVNVIMGDFNAKIGSDNQGYENVMGVHGLGVMNDNEERFVNACAANNIVIGGSVFPHKRIHKATWVSPDQVTENQIDHMGINKMFRRSLQDVRVKRGADVASDHHLVTARLKLKLITNEVDQERRKGRYNVDYLKDQNTAQEYKVAFGNRCKALQELYDEDEGVNIDRHWSHIKEAVNTTCEEVIGRRKPQQKDWISAETIRKIQIRKDKKGAVNSSRTRAAKAAAQKKHTAANREVRKSVKTDKRDIVEGLAEEAERAAASRNMKQLYDTTKKLAGKFKKSERPIRDKNGTVLTGVDKQLNRWAEHFGELLNRPRPHNQPDIQPAEDDLLINCNKPTRKEIKRAIGHIQNGKAAGPDGFQQKH